MHNSKCIQVSREDWNACATTTQGSTPFVRWEFLNAMETSNSVVCIRKGGLPMLGAKFCQCAGVLVPMALEQFLTKICFFGISYVMGNWWRISHQFHLGSLQ